MQIHELTKLQKQLEEGLLDGVKAAVRTAKAGYKAGGIGGAAATLADPRAFARQQNAVYKQKNKSDLAALADKMNKGKKPGSPGYWYPPGTPEAKAQQAAKAVSKNPQAVQQINNLTAQFQDTFGTPMPTPGNKFVLPADKTGYQADYYMSDKGVWTNDETPPKQITDAPTLQKLNSMVDAGAAKEVPINDVAVDPITKTQKTGKVKSTVAERSSNVRRQQRAKNGTTQTNKKLALKDFGSWATQNIPNIDTALQDATAKAEIQSLSNQIKTSTDVEKATPLFKKLMTTVLGTTGNAGAGSGTGGASNGQGMPPANFINLIKTQGIAGLETALQDDKPRQPTGSKTLDATLRAAHLLAEELKAFKVGK